VTQYTEKQAFHPCALAATIPASHEIWRDRTRCQRSEQIHLFLPWSQACRWSAGWREHVFCSSLLSAS